MQAQRLDTLLACFNLSSSREELQAVESPLRALCCLLIYLFVQVDTLSLEDLHAFIAQALCLQGKSTSQLMHLQLDYINSRAVQLGSLLVRGLTTLVLVNSACGFPGQQVSLCPGMCLMASFSIRSTCSLKRDMPWKFFWNKIDRGSPSSTT